MELRPTVAAFAFDGEQFRRLCLALEAGDMASSRARLPTAPVALQGHGVAGSQIRALGVDARENRERGNHAIAAGQVAALVLNGGMATRFGGGAKGVVPVLTDDPETFLSLKLGDCHQRGRDASGSVPVVVMNSFATHDASLAHLREIDWAGLAPQDRMSFDQSIMPRVDPRGRPLVDAAGALPDRDLYAAPGHGDTLTRLRSSGVLEKLLERGVEHILVSNVDNLGASLDPVAVGAHIESTEAGADVTVEVVRRREGDAGGCVALVENRPVIVEGFRLPEGVDGTRYPHFNTNTLWFRASALDREFPLTWFAVNKHVELADGRTMDVVQFERLIGQVTEFLPSAYIEVDRDERFLPVKTRGDLAALAPRMRRLVQRHRA